MVDINFGCPVKQVTEKAHSGSYLLRSPDRVGAIVERVVAACAPTPVTAKIRLGCTRDSINAIDVAQVVEAGRRRGADGAWPHGARFFHRLGRLGADLGDQAALEADSADRQRRPRFGRSGGRSVSPLRVDGVMIARAALNRPWLFRQVQAALAGEADSARSDARPKSANSCCTTTSWFASVLGQTRGRS